MPGGYPADSCHHRRGEGGGVMGNPIPTMTVYAGGVWVWTFRPVPPFGAENRA